jgi:hypothetical protein
MYFESGEKNDCAQTYSSTRIESVLYTNHCFGVAVATKTAFMLVHKTHWQAKPFGLYSYQHNRIVFEEC